MNNKFFFLLFIFVCSFANSQTNLDSLYTIWEDNAQKDSIRANAYYDYIWDGVLFKNPDNAFTLAEELLIFAQEKQLPKAMADAYKLQGVSFRLRGNYQQAIDYFQRGLKINKEIEDKKGIAGSLNNIGIIYKNQGVYPKAIDFYLRSLKIYEEIRYKRGIASSLINIGNINYYRSDYQKALYYYQRSLKITEELGNKQGIAKALNNIGLIYRKQGDYSEALDYYLRSLMIEVELGNKHEIANSLNGIGIIYKNQSNYPKALDYYQRSLKIKEEIGDKRGISKTLTNIGNIFYYKSDYQKALDHYQRSLKITEELGNKQGIAIALTNIGLIYKNQGNYSKAMDYYQRSLLIEVELGNKQGIASSLNNIGSVYKDQSNYPKAVDYYQRSLKIKEEIEDIYGIATTLNNIGLIYKNQGNYPKALDYYESSLKIYKEIGGKQGIAKVLNNIGLIYIKQGIHRDAITQCQRALNLGKEIGAVYQQKKACSCLYEAYKAIGNGNQALAYHEQMLVLNDSLQSKETAKTLQQMEFANQILADSLVQVEKDLKVEMVHQTEVRKKDKNKNLAIGAGIFFLLLSGGFYGRWRYVKKSKAILEKEKDRSENLLLNILPSEIAEELKLKGSADARDFDLVTVLFTDFKGFTKASEKLTAKELIAEINHCFMAFDHICGKYGIEKIKTIGDSYMAVGGLPIPSDDSTKQTILAALEMQSFITERIKEKQAKNEAPFEMRLGINTGPVVAGIVGVKKFQYDIWGDTVNTASRMESSGEIRKVNISKDTYVLIKDDPQFSFVSRGKIQAKSKGELEMYFVSMQS